MTKEIETVFASIVNDINSVVKISEELEQLLGVLADGIIKKLDNIIKLLKEGEEEYILSLDSGQTKLGQINSTVITKCNRELGEMTGGSIDRNINNSNQIKEKLLVALQNLRAKLEVAVASAKENFNSYFYSINNAIENLINEITAVRDNQMYVGLIRAAIKPTNVLEDADTYVKAAEQLKKKIQERRSIALDVLQKTRRSVEIYKTDNNKQVIMRRLYDEMTYTIDLNTTLARKKIETDKYIILWDANFVKDLNERREKNGKAFFDIIFPANNFIVIDDVARELAYIPPDKHHPLAPELSRYLSEKLDGNYNVQVGAIQEERDEVFNIWKNHTRKGIKASGAAIDKFKKSGDVGLVIYCIRNQGREIAILTSDEDIDEIIGYLKNKSSKHGFNVNPALLGMVKVVKFDEIKNYI